MKRIAVFGAAGVMARGIVEVLLTHTNCEVAAFDVVFQNEAKLKAAQKTLKLSLYQAGRHEKKLVYRSREDVLATFNRVVWLTPESGNLAAYLPNCDLVIEAVIEDEKIKKDLYAQIEKYANPDTPIFTNTSTIKISRLAEELKRPERFMGLHFFNPVPMMKPIEAILHQTTSSQTVVEAEKIAKILGKKLLFAPDTPGFAVNGAFVQAIKIVLEEIEAGANYEEIDKACRAGKWVNFSPARRFVETIIQESTKLIAKYKEDPKLHSFSEEQIKESIEELMKLGTNMPAGPFELDKLLKSGRAEEILKDPKSTEKYKLCLAMGPAQFIDLVGIDVVLDCVKAIAVQEPERGWAEPKILVDMRAAGKLGVNKGREGFYKYGPQADVEYPEEGYAKIIFNNGKRNTLSNEFIKKLRGRLAELKHSGKTWKGIFLQGKGRTFSTGADIGEFPICLMDEEERKYAINEGRLLMQEIADFPAPVIAVVEGYAFGGGYEIALACDYIIAKDGAEVGLPEIGLGILPGWCGTQHLPLRAGLEKAIDMILNAKTVNAEFPWVDVVLKKEDFAWENIKKAAESSHKRTHEPIHTLSVDKCAIVSKICSTKLRNWLRNFEICLRLTAYPKTPASAHLALRAIYEGNAKNLSSGLDDEWHAILAAFKTKDADDGIRHFLETGKHLFERNQNSQNEGK